MVSSRDTRLLRVPDLQHFQQAITLGALGVPPSIVRDTAVVVPTAGAAEELRHTIEELILVQRWHPTADEMTAAGASEWPAGGALVLPYIVSRAGLYQLLESRSSGAPPLLDRFEREVLFERAAARAAATVPAPFEVRPALLTEMQLFYDTLGRHGRSINDFERLVGGPLEAGAAIDRGARRLLDQTRFLAATFREYERARTASGAFDEHLLRAFVLAGPLSRPLRRVVIATGDQSTAPAGLFRSDYDLLTRLPGLESILVVATEAMLSSGYLSRLLEALPEIDVRAVAPGAHREPVLAAPSDDERLHYTSRDREEELGDFVERVRALATDAPDDQSGESAASDAAAFVYQRPLPYLALARQVFEAGGVTWQAVDAQPLAAEPYAAALDLVLSAVTTDYARGPILALLRAPQFHFAFDGRAPSREELAACDRELRQAFFLGGRDRLLELRDRWRAEVLDGEDDHFAGTTGTAGLKSRPPYEGDVPHRGVVPYRGDARADRHARARQRRRMALHVVETILPIAEQLQPLQADAPAAEHLRVLEAFIRAVEAPPHLGPATERWLRARGAIVALLQGLGAAFVRFGDSPRPFAAVAALLRRLVEEHTFNPRVGPGIVHLVDAEAAPYGRFAHVTLAGVVEGEWPGGGGRDIFYPSGLLRDLGWPSEADRRAAGRAAFEDLLRLASKTVAISTLSLDDEAIVRPSPLVEDLDRAGLTVQRARGPAGVEAGRTRSLALAPLTIDGYEEARDWEVLRASRLASDGRFRGAAGPVAPRAYAVTGIDRYLQCPFKYFAAQVLGLEEEPDDRPGLTVQERGQFVHDVFHEFFSRWHRAGHGAIDMAGLDAARSLFVEVVDERLQSLPESERPLERARLVGSIAGAGLGERAFRFEAGRPVPIVERLLELALDGTYAIGEARARLRGTADRIDLLADGTLRVLDYKTGKASSARDALQIPVYAFCAEQRLEGRGGRSWTVGEAGYLAFGRPEPYVSVVTADCRQRVLTEASEKLADAIARIERGEFPVTPEEPHLCMYCGYSSVCRKDYVEEE